MVYVMIHRTKKVFCLYFCSSLTYSDMSYKTIHKKNVSSTTCSNFLSHPHEKNLIRLCLGDRARRFRMRGQAILQKLKRLLLE